MSALFGNKNKKNKEIKEDLKNLKEGGVEGENSSFTDSAIEQVGSFSFSGIGSAGAHKILRGFYVSEKASMGTADNQYMFRVFKEANKSEVKKEVSKLFNVKVKSVKILNMPEKRRDFGKHPGSRSGFKKAIVILKDGYTIGQAKP